MINDVLSAKDAEVAEKSFSPKYPIRKNRDVPDDIFENWQNVVDLLAAVSGVPAALITRAHETELEVFSVSNSVGNPYKKGAVVPLDGNNYCEAVIEAQSAVQVMYAPDEARWRDNRHDACSV